MGLMTKAEYIESLRKLKPTVYMFGEKIENVVDNPRLRAGIEATGATYELAEIPEYRDLIVTHSTLIDEPINRFNNPPQSIADLVARVKINRLLGRRVGTCFQRCTGPGLPGRAVGDDLRRRPEVRDRVQQAVHRVSEVHAEERSRGQRRGDRRQGGPEPRPQGSAGQGCVPPRGRKTGGRDRRARRQVPSDRIAVGARDHRPAHPRPAQGRGGVRGGLCRSDRHGGRDPRGRPVEPGHPGAGRLRLRQRALFQVRPDGHLRQRLRPLGAGLSLRRVWNSPPTWWPTSPPSTARATAAARPARSTAWSGRP